MLRPQQTLPPAAGPRLMVQSISGFMQTGISDDTHVDIMGILWTYFENNSENFFGNIVGAFFGFKIVGIFCCYIQIKYCLHANFKIRVKTIIMIT